jgi:uncharacterized protein YcbK (DUF882 family)
MSKLPAAACGVPTSFYRRGFLRQFGAAALGLAAAGVALAVEEAPAGGAAPSGDAAPSGGRRSLSFFHTHTAESLTAVYYEAGAYCAAVLQQVNELLRDFRTGTVYPIDPLVLDRLFALQSLAGSSEPFQVISGYRSPVTNAALRKASDGVAEHSLHMEGRAIDVRLPGVATSLLAALARRQAAGGVGYYEVSDFVHLDTGRVRSWGDPIRL